MFGGGLSDSDGYVHKILEAPFPPAILEPGEACWEHDFYNNKCVWKTVVQGHFCWL